MRKNWEKTWKTYWQKKRRRQIGGFLIRYNFVFTDRDTLNQIVKIAPEIMKQAAGQIEKLLKIELIRLSGLVEQRLKEYYLKNLRGAMEDVHKTPFRLLENFNKQQFQKIKGKILC